MDEDSRLTIEYLRGLPEHGTVHWASHHVAPDHPWTTHWVDIRITDEGSPPMSWVWTIIAEADRDRTDAEQLWQFAWPFDIDVHIAWGPNDGSLSEWVTPPGEPLPEPAHTECAALAEETGGGYEVRGGWTVDAIEAGLSHWAMTWAGRSDLRFEWDLEAPEPPYVMEARERMRERAERTPPSG